MLDVLTFNLDDMGAGATKLLAILAVVLASIVVVLLRDLFVWFEALGREAATPDNASEAAEEAVDLPVVAVAADTGPARPFVDRRNPANAVTGFGRRKGDFAVPAQQHAA